MEKNKSHLQEAILKKIPHHSGSWYPLLPFTILGSVNSTFDRNTKLLLITTMGEPS